MAIVEYSGGASPQTKTKKKKRREEEAPAPRPQRQQYDPEEAGRAVVGAYYRKTGKLPAVDTFQSMVKEVATNPLFAVTPDADNLFPDWVREIENPDDIPVHKMLIDPVEAVFRRMSAAGTILSDSDLRFQREQERLKQQREEQIEVIAYNKQPEARTEFRQAERWARLTEGAETSMFYEAMDADEEVFRFSDKGAERKLLEIGDVMMSTKVIESKRKEFGGRERKELTVDQRLELDEFAQKLAYIYRDEFSSHYAFDTSNVVWDAFFDKYAARYIVESNLPYALIDSPLDPEGKWKKQAMKNISAATYGEIKPTGDEYALLQMLGMSGDPNDPYRTSDEYATMLWTGYYQGRRENWTEREAAVAYAADFGKDMLPGSVRQAYDEYMQDWNPHIAASVMKYEQIAVAASQAAAEPGMVALDHDAEKVAVYEAVMSLAKSVYGEGDIPEVNIEAPVQAERATRRGGAHTATQQFEAKLIKAFVLPAAGLEPEQKSIWEDFNYVYDRGMMAFSYGVNAFMGQTLKGLGIKTESVINNTYTQEEYDILAKNGFSQEDMHDFGAAWVLAAEHADIHKAGQAGWADSLLERLDFAYGTDLKDNAYLRFGADLMWKFGVDMLLDAGIGTMARLSVKGAASTARAAEAAGRGGTVAKGALLGERTTALEGMKATVGRLFTGPKMSSRIKSIDDDIAKARKALAETNNTVAVKELNQRILYLKKTRDDMLTRPLWYDTIARGMAKGEQGEAFTQQFLGLTADGLGWERRVEGGKEVRHLNDALKAKQWNEVRDISRRIGRSRDADEITDLFLQLRSKGYRVDPGADFIAKQHLYNHLKGVYDSGAAFLKALPYGRRAADAVDDPLPLMDEIGSMSNMGRAKGDKQGIRELADLLERAAATKGDTFSTIAQQRQQIWNEMWDTIEANLMARTVSSRELSALKMIAKIAGVDIGKVENRLDLFNAVQKVKQGGRGLRGKMAARYARMYLPGYEVDELSGARKLVEKSKVAKSTQHPVVQEAQAKYDNAKSAYDAVKTAKAAGKSSGKELQAAHKEVEVAFSELELARKTHKFSEVQPFLEGQLSRDLVSRMNPHELFVFNSGFFKFDTLMHIGVLGGVGPSVHGSVAAFRTFVLARLGFAVTTSFGDEFWRLIPEGVWSTIFRRNGEFRKTMKELKDTKLVAKAVADNLTDMMRMSDSWTGVTHEAPDYHIWLNGYFEMMRDENTVKVMQQFPRLTGEADEAYRLRLIGEIRKLIDGTSSVPFADETGYIIREHLRQMGRLPAKNSNRAVREGVTAAERKKIREQRIAAGQKAQDDYSRAYFSVEDNLRQQSELSQKVGRLGPVTKRFRISWLRAKYAQPVPAGPAARSHDTANFMSELRAAGREEEGGVVRITVDYGNGITNSAKVHLVPGAEYGAPEDLYLLKIESEYAGTGAAEEVQRRIFAIADRNGVSIGGTPQGTMVPRERLNPRTGEITPNPQYGTTISDDDLAAYYRRNGWDVSRDARGNPTMSRQPATGGDEGKAFSVGDRVEHTLKDEFAAPQRVSGEVVEVLDDGATLRVKLDKPATVNGEQSSEVLLNANLVEGGAPTGGGVWYREGGANEYSEFTFVPTAKTGQGKFPRMTSARGSGVASGQYAYASPGPGRVPVRAPKNPLRITRYAAPEGYNPANFFFREIARPLLAHAEGKATRAEGSLETVVTALIHNEFVPKSLLAGDDWAANAKIVLGEVEEAIKTWNKHKQVHPLNILLDKWGYDGIEWAGDMARYADSGDYGNIKFPPIDKNGKVLLRRPRKGEGNIYMYSDEVPASDAGLAGGGAPTGRELTNAEVEASFGDVLKDANVARQMKADYHRGLVAKRGVQAEYDELMRLKGEHKSLVRQRSAAKKARVATEKAPAERPYANLEEWLNLTGEHLVGWERFPLAREAIVDGKKLSKAEVKQLIKEMQDAGVTPPPVIGVTNIPRWGEGYIPGVSQLAEMGPFRLLDFVTNSMRKSTFTHWQMRHYDEMIAAGVDADTAFGRAAAMAAKETDRAMFTHNMTAFEYATKDFILFQPAYRQFAKYWGAQLIKHPFVMKRLKETFGTEYPAMRIPGTNMETILPMPFWMQGDVTESALPGFSPLIIMPLRVLNYATGWDWQEDKQQYIYTGATDYDWISEIPTLSFTSKASSPTSWLDDLLWGIAPDWQIPDGTSSRFWSVLDSGRMSFFKDPEKRKQFAMNVAQAQIAAGMKPDFTAGIDEMRETPFWWRLIEGADILNIVENPDAVLAAGTKLLNPLTGKVTYDPSIMSPEKTKFFWERWAGTTPRTMADAQWEYMQAFGDEDKMNAVLERFPRYAEVVRFWDKDIEERVEYLSKDENLWITPYVTGKYVYNNGLPLIGGEFWDEQNKGAIYRKNLNAFLRDIQEVYLNIGYSRTLKKLEAEHKRDTKAADAFAMEAINKLSNGNAKFKDNLLSNYEAYKNEWTSPAPGDDYNSPERHPPTWLVLAARAAGIEGEPFKWDVAAIAKRMTDAQRLVSDGGKRLEAQGVYDPLTGKGKIQASSRGIADRWTNKGIYDRNEYEQKLGAALSLARGLTKYTSPRWKYLTDPQYSVSWTEISDILKKKRDYDDYLTQKFVAGEYWKLSNPRELFAIGVKTKNLAGMEQGMVDLNQRYWQYQADLAGIKEGSSEYKAIRARYIQDRNSILSRSGMEAFKDGPAGRLYAAYGKYGRGVGRNWLEHVIATMTKKNQYNPQALVNEWLDAQYRPDGYEKRAERAAWASLSAVAIRFREEMKGQWNETMQAYGISPEAKGATIYLNKLKDYATIWGRTSKRFRKRYLEMGGEDLLKDMLDPNF